MSYKRGREGKMTPAEAAEMARDEIDWSKYPNLRRMYENRPTINVWWEELTELARELVDKGFA